MSTQDGFRRSIVCGLPITNCSMNDIPGLIDRLLGTEGQHQIATVNLDILRLANYDHDLAQTLHNCRHCFADGWPIKTIAANNGETLRDRVTGSDMTPMLIEQAHQHGWRLGFVGGSKNTQLKLARHIRQMHPGTFFKHWTPSYIDITIDQDLCSDIRDHHIDLLFVAMGCPKQEQWLAKNLQASGAKIGIGVGGSLDFIAGVQCRSPRVWQNLHLEFAFRLLNNPKRLWKRYAADLAFFITLLAHPTLASYEMVSEKREKMDR